MKILLTGATGYIGKRVLSDLIADGHHVVCSVRDKERFSAPKSFLPSIEVIEVDLLKEETFANIPVDIEAAYYLVHSMAASSDYEALELLSAQNFRTAIDKTQARQVIYLSGIVNDTKLSKHLSSRKNVEQELGKGRYHLTTLRAGIIIGSGSASFEIIRDLVEKLPVMVTPKWLNTKCQPIAIGDVVTYLTKALGDERTYDQSFDIGGPDVLTYKEMLLGFAKIRNLNRSIWVLPVMTPKLSSYWLYFVTATSYKLAVALVHSMKVEVVCSDNRIRELIPTENISYTEAIDRAFSKIQNHETISSWKDSFASGDLEFNLSDFILVPEFGCFRDVKQVNLKNKDATLERIWNIGGETGWYYATWLWKIRGYLDKIVGGVGLRRGRTNPEQIHAGDAIDFWRVLYANKEEGRLLLFAEMQLPGEAWLEFRLEGDQLIQTATFRPRGLAGRLYWYSVLPFHGFIFKGMVNNINTSK
jgi:uncharacterized protein YbjT (DUF2867 family)